MSEEKKTANEYISAAFQPKKHGIFYQFKLRKNASEPMFAIVQKGSVALASLKKGDVIPMIYYFQDKTIPAEKKSTRIKYITDGNTLGYKDHFMIGLDVGCA